MTRRRIREAQKYSRTVFTLTPSGAHDHVGVLRAKFKKVLSEYRASSFTQYAAPPTGRCELIFDKLWRLHPVWLTLADYARRVNFNDKKRNEKIPSKYLYDCYSIKLINAWRQSDCKTNSKENMFNFWMISSSCIVSSEHPCCALLATAELHSRDQTQNQTETLFKWCSFQSWFFEKSTRNSENSNKRKNFKSFIL